ncbi:hypothetical protein GCM10023231_35360 [Olivibacter ginsenosidimutans]|uniref:N-acetyltransferase domain-containing protein n=1 Tax=Olivibacter ginsenosidimutans TaxID=1176537 RepID=A0ABP9C2U7_9SPHI
MVIPATTEDKALVIKILADAFQENKSVNYLVKQDRKRQQRLEYLMDYSFDLCWRFGKVFLNKDKTAVALLLYPDQKRVDLKTLLLDLKLVLRTIGLRKVKKALHREARIKAQYPSKEICYLWFIGVESKARQKGKGSEMLRLVIEEAKKQDKSIYLETSTRKNILWYERHGFHIFKTLDFGYSLYLLKHESTIPGTIRSSMISPD